MSYGTSGHVSASWACAEPPSAELGLLVLFSRLGGVRPHRPPWTLMMGLPVLVMETSCSPLLQTVCARRGGVLAAARKPLQAGEAHDFCMAAR